jgi:hypothetical protein
VLLFSVSLFSLPVILIEDGEVSRFEEGALLSEEGIYYISSAVVRTAIDELLFMRSSLERESVMVFPEGLTVRFHEDTRSATVDRERTLNDVLRMKDDELFIRAGFLSFLTGWDYDEFGGVIYLYDTMPSLYKVSETVDQIRLIFDSELLPEMVSHRMDVYGHPIVTVSPARVSMIETDHSFTVYEGLRHIRFVLERNWERYSVSIDGNELIIGRRDVFGQTLFSDRGEGYVFETVRAEFGSRHIIMSYLEIEPRMFDVSLVLARDRLPAIEAIAGMASRVSALGLINAGYYDPAVNSPIGFLMDQGQVLSLPTLGRPVFYMTSDNHYGIARISPSLFIKINDVTAEIRGVNTHYKGETLLYTDVYSSKIAYHDTHEYITIIDDMVKSIGYKEYVDQGEMVLAFSRESGGLFGSVVRGHEAVLEFVSSVPKELMLAVEGGPLIINRGLPVSTHERNQYSSSIISTRAPRTLVGITRGGNVMFITIDGYQQSSSGLTFDEMLEFFRDKGFYSLMCLDGGRSSALIFKGSVMSSPAMGMPTIPVSIAINHRNK